MAVTRSPSPASARGARLRASARDWPAAPGRPAGLLGRDRELAELSGLFERDRLVTLTGAPGIGKSRLAVELAGRFRGGGQIVELAPVARPADIPRALATCLSVDEVAGQDLTDTVVARLRRRRIGVIVLDNCEHLLPASAKLARALLAGCPDIRILATSREPLGLAAETVWRLAPLAVPRSGEQQLPPERLVDFGAVALFAQRAGAVQPGFALNSYVAATVAEICRRLDGLPLAIELAAARVQSLTPQEIAARLDDRFSLLSDADHGLASQHRTLEAALDWSHDLLTPPQRALLRRLAVFAGGFDLESAEAVCADAGDVSAKGQRVSRREPQQQVLSHDVAELLQGLVAKSLVTAGGASSPPPRYRLLETIRAYAAAKLDRAGETVRLRQAHARFYLELAERAEPEFTGPDQERWFERLEAERANLRSALEWSLSHGHEECALRLVGALVLFWRVRCHFTEGRELLEAALSASEEAPAPVEATALWGAAFMALMAGDTTAAVPYLDKSLARFRELGDGSGCARVLLLRAGCAQQQRHDPAAIFSLLEESAALARDAGDSWCLAHALGLSGLEHCCRDELDPARRLLEESAAVAQEAKDKQGLRFALLVLGPVALRQGDYHAAERTLTEAAVLSEELGEDYSRATALLHLGACASGQGEWSRAWDLVDEAAVLFRHTRPVELVAPLVNLVRLARARDDRRQARALAEEALTLARAGAPNHWLAVLAMGELTAEEGEVREARCLLEEALELARAAGDRRGAATALHELGQLSRAEGDPKRAAAFHTEALALRREVANARGMAASLEAIAGLDPAAGGYAHSARLLGAAQALRDALGAARTPWESSSYEADIAVMRDALGNTRFTAAFAEGAKLSLEEAVTEGSRRTNRRGRPAAGWSSLTPREQQVAALLGEGLTNPEIAERLVVSLATVKTHLSHIFAKLGVTRRRELLEEVRRREQQLLQ